MYTGPDPRPTGWQTHWGQGAGARPPPPQPGGGGGPLRRCRGHGRPSDRVTHPPCPCPRVCPDSPRRGPVPIRLQWDDWPTDKTALIRRFYTRSSQNAASPPPTTPSGGKWGNSRPLRPPPVDRPRRAVEAHRVPQCTGGRELSGVVCGAAAPVRCDVVTAPPPPPPPPSVGLPVPHPKWRHLPLSQARHSVATTANSPQAPPSPPHSRMYWQGGSPPPPPPLQGVQPMPSHCLPDGIRNRQ